MQQSSVPGGWFSNRGQNIPIFPHLKSVPPPPMLPPPSHQLPAPFGFGAQRQQKLSHRAGHATSNSGHRGGNRRESGHSSRGFSKFGGRGRHRQHGSRARGSQAASGAPRTNIIKPTCDTCDKAFPDDNKLAEHLALHQVCGLDGCKFSAHPKIVAAHVDMQHRTGLYKQLVIGADPEEVSKWREERKNRFPTRENIQRKLQAKTQQIARGERISAPRGRFNHRGRANWNDRPNFNRFNSQQDKKQVEVKPVILELPRALASLAGNYASSSESDEAPEETPISHVRSGLEPPAKKLRVETSSAPPQRQTVRQQYVARRRPPTLLQKLLDSEIRHERNVILQCVRHILNNNFFQ